MRVLQAATTAVLVFLMAAQAHAVTVEGSSVNYDILFSDFKAQYGRRYSTVAEEKSSRLTFEANMRRAAKLQAENPHASFGANKFTDISAADFKKTHHNADFTPHFAQRKKEGRSKGESSWRSLGLPPFVQVNASKQIDWRKKGAVTPVKDQHGCGGCWSFSTTGNIEGQWQIAGNPLTSLSEQQLLSCDTNTGNAGCDGGIMEYAFTWLIQSKGGNLDTEASYPFKSQNGTVPPCQPTGHTNGATITSWMNLPQDETRIAHFLYSKGPASIGVDGSSFQTYKGGILTNCQNLQLDHAVLIVGYDETNKPPYWIIKNSWGTTWGEAGYIRVEKGTNQCGLKEGACTSVIGGAPQTPQPPTAPPSPPTPQPAAPPIGGKNFTMEVCSVMDCQSCTTYTFPQGVCVDEVFIGDSFRADCLSEYKISVKNYERTNSCNAWYTANHVDTDSCLENIGTPTTYLKFHCPSP